MEADFPAFLEGRRWGLAGGSFRSVDHLPSFLFPELVRADFRLTYRSTILEKTLSLLLCCIEIQYMHL